MTRSDIEKASHAGEPTPRGEPAKTYGVSPPGRPTPKDAPQPTSDLNHPRHYRRVWFGLVAVGFALLIAAIWWQSV